MRNNKSIGSLIYYLLKIIAFVYNFRNGSGNKETGYIQLEEEILTPLAGTGKLYALQV